MSYTERLNNLAALLSEGEGQGDKQLQEINYHGGHLSQGLDPGQEAMFDQVLMSARNEGRFYKNKDAKGAVDFAIREYIKYKNQEMREDSRIIKKQAVKALEKEWRTP